MSDWRIVRVETDEVMNWHVQGEVTESGLTVDGVEVDGKKQEANSHSRKPTRTWTQVQRPWPMTTILSLTTTKDHGQHFTGEVIHIEKIAVRSMWVVQQKKEGSSWLD